MLTESLRLKLVLGVPLALVLIVVIACAVLGQAEPPLQAVAHSAALLPAPGASVAPVMFPPPPTRREVQPTAGLLPPRAVTDDGAASSLRLEAPMTQDAPADAQSASSQVELHRGLPPGAGGPQMASRTEFGPPAPPPDGSGGLEVRQEFGSGQAPPDIPGTQPAPGMVFHGRGQPADPPGFTTGPETQSR